MSVHIKAARLAIDNLAMLEENQEATIQELHGKLSIANQKVQTARQVLDKIMTITHEQLVKECVLEGYARLEREK